MKKKFSKELIIGFTVLLSLLILFFGIDYLKGINVFKAANYYYVSYTNVSGLTISSPVTANGFKVGLVRDMQYEYDNPGHILVELSLDKALKIPQGTKAILKTDMLGTASIELIMPDEITAESNHSIGDKIAGEVSTGLMDDVSQNVLPLATKVDSLLTTVNILVNDPALLNSLQRLDKITANLEASTSQLAKTMNSMPKIMSDAGNISGNLSTITDNLNELSTELKNMPIDSTMQQIYSTTKNINDITEKINSENSSLGLLLNDTGLYNNMNNAAGSLDSLLIDIKKNPKRYISIKLL
ncbi:MAG: MCE family protein [Muribaculaceae bacterium]|nr:MCE family protein [Muribaculaceae bacterium]